jgi:hypothetical protein
MMLELEMENLRWRVAQIENLRKTSQEQSRFAAEEK